VEGLGAGTRARETVRGDAVPGSLPLPTADDMRNLLLRLDPIQSWARRAYALEAVPGFYGVVRRAQLGLFRDGRVLYWETSTVGFRGFKYKRWMGRLGDLGRPRDAPIGFVAVKALRLHAVNRSSFIVPIDGEQRIICFTGLRREGLPRPRIVTAAENIPTAGPVLGWIDEGVTRLKNPDRKRLAVEATEVWRSVLERRADLASLPLLSAPAPASG
jgi:hypothetical protein